MEGKHRVLPAAIWLCFMLVIAFPVLARQALGGDPKGGRGATGSKEGSAPHAEARTYYVSPAGNNGNPGTRERPWASPGYGSRRLRPGDTLVLLGGRYTLREYDSDIITPPSGRADAPITIKGEEGSRPVLAGRDNLITAINLSGVSHVRIENLEITHDDKATGKGAWFRDGLQILEKPSSYIVLKDLHIHHVDEFGMNIQDVEDLQILNCRIEYAGFGALGGPAGERGGWRNVVVRGSRLSWSGHYYQGGDGSNRPYDRPDGFGIEPSRGPVLIEDTVAEHNRGDGFDSKAAETVIRRCVVANNSCDGVKLWGDNSRIEDTLIYGRGDGDPSPSPWAPIVIHNEGKPGARFEIRNVTVDDQVGRNYLLYAQYDNPQVPVRISVSDTIFSGRGPQCPIFIGRASTFVARRTFFHLPQNETVVVHGDRSYTCGSLASLGQGNACGDPMFVRPAWGTTGDYRLREGSPAVGMGAPDSILGGRKESPSAAAREPPAPAARPSASAPPAAKAQTGAAQPLNPNPPAKPLRLVFIHHSTGEDWLKPDGGNLRQALNDNRYYVTDTNYDWGPEDRDSRDGKRIGHHTDIGHWYNWFLGPNRDIYLRSLYGTRHVSDAIGKNSIPDPGGENVMVLFKSCFTSAQVIYGSPNDPPIPKGQRNPLYGQDAMNDTVHTVGNIKGLYRDLLGYFATRPDRLFVLITTPPSHDQAVDREMAANLRAINMWLVRQWLEGYPHRNVAVFDYHNVLTSNGGNPRRNDLGAATGSHHRYRDGKVEHVAGKSDFLAYPSEGPDNHPTAAGHKKATGEFLPLLNIFVHCWQGDGGCPR
jgi:hypothetical protein